MRSITHAITGLLTLAVAAGAQTPARPQPPTTLSVPGPAPKLPKVTDKAPVPADPLPSGSYTLTLTATAGGKTFKQSDTVDVIHTRTGAVGIASGDTTGFTLAGHLSGTRLHLSGSDSTIVLALDGSATPRGASGTFTLSGPGHPARQGTFSLTAPGPDVRQAHKIEQFGTAKPTAPSSGGCSLFNIKCWWPF